MGGVLGLRRMRVCTPGAWPCRGISNPTRRRAPSTPLETRTPSFIEHYDLSAQHGGLGVAAAQLRCMGVKFTRGEVEFMVRSTHHQAALPTKAAFAATAVTQQHTSCYHSSD